MIRALLWLAMAAPLAAQEHAVDEKLTRCLDAPEGVSTHGQRQCFATALEDWDRALNLVWGDLLDTLPNASHAALRSAQREWLKFRDAEFKAIAASYGAMEGTMYQVMADAAAVRVVADRVKQLEALRDAQQEP